MVEIREWNPKNKACHTCKNRSCKTYENEYGKCEIWYCELKEKTIGFDIVGFGADGFDMKPVVECENCALYKYYSECPVFLYFKDGIQMTDWKVEKAYKILFENEEIKDENEEIEEEKEQKKMTVEELVKVLDKAIYFRIKEPHKRNCIYQSVEGANWEKIKERFVMQVSKELDGFVIYVAPPTGK